jgi:protein-tyrosine phosphatase
MELRRWRPDLKGALNFRDLGGYAIADGRVVRWRVIFRSGALATLTEAGIAHLEAMGINTICDLRGQTERENDPHPVLSATRYCAWDYELEGLHNWHLLRPPVTAEKLRDVMIQFYRDMPWIYAPHIGGLFEHIAAGHLPLIVNCAAGKDRTGLAVALLLDTIGVPRKIVFEDYAISDQYTNFERDMVQPKLCQGRKDAAGFRELSELTVEQRRPLLRSDPSYIAAALEAIETRCGTVREYLETECRVREEMIEKIKINVLEEPAPSGDAG